MVEKGGGAEGFTLLARQESVLEEEREAEQATTASEAERNLSVQV